LRLERKIVSMERLLEALSASSDIMKFNVPDSRKMNRADRRRRPK